MVSKTQKLLILVRLGAGVGELVQELFVWRTNKTAALQEKKTYDDGSGGEIDW